MDLTDGYLSTAECDAMIAVRLPAAHPFRVAWGLLDTASKARAILRASDAIDGVKAWIGRVAEREQPRQWPRIEASGSAYVRPDVYASAIGDPTVPRAVKAACAVQAGFVAAQDLGGDPHEHLREAAARGVVSHSAAGATETLDPQHARSAMAALSVEAQTLLRPLMAGVVRTV